MNNNKNIGSSNIGENLSPHKHQSSVVNISKQLDWKKEFNEQFGESPVNEFGWFKYTAKDLKNFIQSLLDKQEMLIRLECGNECIKIKDQALDKQKQDISLEIASYSSLSVEQTEDLLKIVKEK